MNNLDLFLSLYDVQTIVEHFFPKEDRERFLKDYRSYQNSFWGRILKKEPFYSYENRLKLPYHKWGDYRVVLDRIARERSTQLEKLSRIVKKEVSRKRRRSVSYIDYDDLSLLDTAFILLLLNALISNDADAKLDLIEKADSPEKALEEMEKPSPQNARGHNDHDNDKGHYYDKTTDNTDRNTNDGTTTDRITDNTDKHDRHNDKHDNENYHQASDDTSDSYDRHGSSYDDSDSGYSYDSGGDWGGGDW